MREDQVEEERHPRHKLVLQERTDQDRDVEGSGNGVDDFLKDNVGAIVVPLDELGEETQGDHDEGPLQEPDREQREADDVTEGHVCFSIATCYGNVLGKKERNDLGRVCRTRPSELERLDATGNLSNLRPGGGWPGFIDDMALGITTHRASKTSPSQHDPDPIPTAPRLAVIR